MRMDEEILGRVDAWRDNQKDRPSRAEAVRRLIEGGLVQHKSSAVTFSDGEKLLLMMMVDLHRHLKIQNGTDHDFVSDVITGGHFWAPKWDMPGIFHDHADTPQDVSLVVDTLDMWSFLEAGHNELSAKDKVRVEKEADPFGKFVKFSGFDGNYEAELIGIARFLIDRMGRFSGFKGRELNSHAPTRGRYVTMVRTFEPMRKTLIGTNLNADQIITILNSQKAGID